MVGTGSSFIFFSVHHTQNIKTNFHEQNFVFTGASSLENSSMFLNEFICQKKKFYREQYDKPENELYTGWSYMRIFRIIE